MIPRPAQKAFRPVLYGPDGHVLAVSGAWKGARKDRKQTSAWIPGAGSADEDLLADLPTLRERSRALQRDNPLAAGAINTAVTSVVGTGLTVQSQVVRELLGWDVTKATEWQKRAEMLFNLWAIGKDSDATRTQNFFQLQDLAFRSTLESGDALALLVNLERPGTFCGTAIQIVEGDRLSNKDGAKDSLTLSGGVQVDKIGAPEAYHVLKQHPGSKGTSTKAWDVVPAFAKSGRRSCLHLYHRTRPDQHRGAPYLATVIEALRELGEFTDGELRAAVISGLFTVFVKSDPANGGGPLDDPSVQEGGGKSGELSLDYGAIMNLEPGESIESATPGRPNSAFDPFVLAILRQIGVALEMPYEILIKHFTASYSAARAALLEMGKFIKRRRFWLATDFCQPIYEAVIEELVAMGLLEAPGFFDDPMLRMAYLGTVWVGDSLGQIDPMKEAEAWEKLVDCRFATRTEATAALTGGDYERNVERLSYEQGLEKELGLVESQPDPAQLPVTRRRSAPTDSEELS